MAKAQSLAYLDLGTLRFPEKRSLLLQRSTALRAALRESGFNPEIVDGIVITRRFGSKGEGLNAVEKLLVFAMVYTGLSVVAAIQTLAEPCGLTPADVDEYVRWYLRTKGSSANRPSLAVAKLLETAEDQLEISKERVLQELARVAMADITDVMSWDVDGNMSFTPSELLTKSQRAAISSVKRTVSPAGVVTVEMQMHNKIPALKILSEHLGIIGNKQEVNVEINVQLAERLEKARTRVFPADRNPSLSNSKEPLHPLITHQIGGVPIPGDEVIGTVIEGSAEPVNGDGNDSQRPQNPVGLSEDGLCYRGLPPIVPTPLDSLDSALDDEKIPDNDPLAESLSKHLEKLRGGSDDHSL